MSVYQTPTGRVYNDMRATVWLLVATAGVAGAQSAEAPSGVVTPAMARAMVTAHNAVRARVGVGPLVWSDPLAAVAQNWADTLVARGRFEHSPNDALGENLFELQGTGAVVAATPEQVVEDWASEARDYDYRSNSCRDVCGHYTQIVWRGTRAVGCAVARGAGGLGRREVWVCEYDPAGNWRGQRPW